MIMKMLRQHLDRPGTRGVNAEHPVLRANLYCSSRCGWWGKYGEAERMHMIDAVSCLASCLVKVICVSDRIQSPLTPGPA